MQKFQNAMEKIRVIAAHYSKKNQWLKAFEEVEELLDELDGASNPFGWENMVNLTGNTWSECADVFIMIMQLTIQHGKEKEFWKWVDYKLNRQLERMKSENTRSFRSRLDRRQNNSYGSKQRNHALYHAILHRKRR